MSGSRITRAEVQQYVNYTLRYYSWAEASGSSIRQSRCLVDTSVGSQCRALQAEALQRLIEERLVLEYAKSHGIRLAHSEQARLSAESRRLLAQRTVNGRSLQQSGITSPFLRSVLETQLLVERVEQRVTSAPGSGGQVFHVQTVTVKPATGQSPASRYNVAQGVVAGDPIPAGSSTKTAWFTRSQLLPGIRAAVLSATAGQTIGPYPVGGSFLVVRVLGWGESVPGEPSDRTAGFRLWLHQMIRHRQVTCFDIHGQREPCPMSNP